MQRRVIPMVNHQEPGAKAEVVRDQRSALIGVTLIVLHLVSLAVALTYF